MSTVPYWWPRRNANSSTPRTVTWPTGGSGSARISRNSVDRLTPIPSRVASREPARPANAKQIASSAAWRPGLRRACRSVNPGTCSMNVHALQSTWSQKNRRNVNHTSTGRPAAGRSAR